MPAASCRIMPARSISRCETISASFGFSFRIGRKNRDNLMTALRNQWDVGGDAVKPDRVRKHKGKQAEKGRQKGWFLQLRLRIETPLRRVCAAPQRSSKS